MKLVPLKEVFDVKYGVNLELNKLELCEGGINFVSRTAKNNGVSARVKVLPNVPPIPAGAITVSGGGSVLETFLQNSDFYSGRDLFYLEAKVELSESDKLVYCSFIKSNKYRYNYGRQANKTLKQIMIPSPVEVKKISKKILIPSIPSKSSANRQENRVINDNKTYGTFLIGDLFYVKKGKRLTKQDTTKGSTPFITAIDSNNGLREHIDKKPIYEKNMITVNYNGNGVAEAFYQPNDFYASDDVNILHPKFELNQFIAMFIITTIRLEKYRFSYGRKWHANRMRESKINLPATETGEPNWAFMESYIKSLPYSSNLVGGNSELEAAKPLI